METAKSIDEPIEVQFDDDIDDIDELNSDKQVMLVIKTTNIKLALEEVLSELGDKVYVYTNLYWKHVYMDRFCGIVVLMTSLVSSIMLALELVDDPKNIIFCVLFGLSVCNTLCNASRLFLKIRTKCVSYNSLSKMYSQILNDSKKTLSNPMNNNGFQRSYESIIARINITDQYASAYRFI
jgi:hypothetical protein